MAHIVRFGLLAVVLFVALAKADDFVVGTTTGDLGFSQTITLPAIELDKRTKYVYWHTKSNSRLIKGISVVDLNDSTSRVTIKSGGLDQTYVKLKLKSEEGEGLNYEVKIYV